ncbi:YdgH/BhsA/McbA-like domain containing protein [Serratia sp. NPDC078593]|uniref:YdgH/BhsA/McbA-like domain containing protein n=1 Tax=unclassified Serratia (in: enterobacteria) TaxID=2647522 RepID=UPI0037D4E535
MKSLKMIITALVVGSVSFGTLAATELTKEDLAKDPGKYEKIGSVSTTAETTSPMDAKAELSKLADEKGGQYYVIIAGREHGKFSAIAEVYKDKM